MFHFMVCMRTSNVTGRFLTDSSAFTILRSVALLQARSWKLLISGILVALGVMLIVIDAVRTFSFCITSEVDLTVLAISTINLPKPGPMSMILYWDHRVSRLIFLSLQALFNGTFLER